jgi:hypothetical protein
LLVLFVAEQSRHNRQCESKASGSFGDYLQTKVSN